MTAPTIAVHVQISMTDPFDDPVWITLQTFWETGSISGGRQHELDQIEASQLTVKLDDRDGRFRTWNRTGPYFNQLTPTDSLPTYPLTIQLATGAGPASTGSWTTTFKLTKFGAVPQGLKGTGTTHTAKYPVVPGAKYRARIHATGTGQGTFGIEFFDSGGSSVGGSTTVGTLPANLVVTMTAPDDAATCELIWTSADTAVLDSAGLYRVPKTHDPGAIWGSGANGLQRSCFSPRRPVRVLAGYTGILYPAFFGYLTKITPDWPTELNADMTLTATDGLKLLSNTYLSNTQLYVNTLLNDGAVNIWRCGDAPGSTQCQSALVTLADGSVVPSVNPRAQGAESLDYKDPLRVRGGAAFGQTQPIIWDPTTGASLSASGTGGGASGWLEFPATGNGHGGFECMFATTARSGVIATWYVGATYSLRVYVNDNGQLVCSGWPTDTLWSQTLDVWTINTLPGVVGKTVTNGRWHHLAVQLRTSTGGPVKVWLDGALVGSFGTIATATTTSPSAVGGAVYTGTIYNAFEGQVANIALYGPGVVGTVAASHAELNFGNDELLTGKLITWLCKVSGWPPALLTLATGITTCQPLVTAIASASFEETTYATTGSPLALSAAMDVITTAQQTEDGLFYQKPTGLLVFVDRHAFYTPQRRTPLVTFSDAGTTGVIAYMPEPEITQDDLDFWDSVQVQRDNGVLQQATSAASASRFGQAVFEGLTDLLQSSTTDALALAQWIVQRYKTPIPRVSEIKLASYTQGGAAVPWMLSLELWEAVQVVRKHAVGVSSAFTQTSVVEGYSHDFTPTRWETTFNLSPYEILVSTWFVLTSETQGVLTSNRVQY